MIEELIAEMSGYSTPELDAAAEAAELALRSAEATLAAAAAVINARGSFREHGHRSMRGYLKARLNCSGNRANKIRRRAELFNHQPSVGAALLAGHIGAEQSDLLAKVAAHPVAGPVLPSFSTQLLDHAEQLEHDDFRTVLDSFVQRADPDGSFDDQQFRNEHRQASVVESQGSINVHAAGGSPLVAAEMSAIFQSAVQAEFEADCATRRAQFGDDHLSHPLPRTSQQRQFDALHAIFISYVTAPVDGRVPQPLVNIVIDQHAAGRVLASHGLVGSADVFGDASQDASDLGTAERHLGCSINGTPVHPDVALHAMIAGRVRRAIVDADGVTIDLGRTQRLFTGKAREAAQLLAVTCTHRGCDVPARFCDIDHRNEWVAHRGATDQRNAMSECGVHDRWKHHAQLRTRRATNGRIYLINPDGSPILPIGAREPEWSEPLPGNTEQPVLPGRELTLDELAGRDTRHHAEDLADAIRLLDLKQLRDRRTTTHLDTPPRRLRR